MEEDKKILLNIQKQVQKNTKILKDLRSKNRREALGKFIYYAVLVFVGIYIWNYIQPVYNSLLDVAGKVNKSGSSIDTFLEKIEKISSFSEKLK